MWLTPDSSLACSIVLTEGIKTAQAEMVLFYMKCANIWILHEGSGFLPKAAHKSVGERGN